MMSLDIDGMIYFFKNILHEGFSQISVKVEEMLAEGDKVATRKLISGKHTNTLFGIAATGKTIAIRVIDILEISEGKITSHWGENNFAGVIEALKS